MTVDGNPWLRIPAADYEAHMAAVGQSAALRDLFARIYAQRRPRRLAVLGCTTGSDLQQIDPIVTELAVGVDVNPAYLAAARTRLSPLGPTLRLIEGDVLSVALPAPFDLVHAALLLEYVDPLALFARMAAWLSPDGCCSVVTQEPMPHLPAVSASDYASLQLLAGHLTLRSADEVVVLAVRSGLRLLHRLPLDLPAGKRLVAALFERSRV
jgi:trans-aconitate methyltransferase